MDNSSNKNWYLVVGKDQKGPVTQKQLANLFETGKLSLRTPVWTKGMAEWLRAESVPEFASMQVTTQREVQGNYSQEGSLQEAQYTPAYAAEQYSNETYNPASEKESSIQQEQLEEIVDTNLSNIQNTPEYLQVNDAPQVRPWVRYWARFIDNIIYTTVPLIPGCIVPLLVPGAGAEIAGLFSILSSITGFLLWMPIEALLLSQTGYTPGKWLFKVKVVNIEGEKLSFSEALARAVKVWFFGLGLCLPLISAITMVFCLWRLGNTGSTRWDESGDFTVHHEKIGTMRITLGVVIMIAGIILSIILGFLSMIAGAVSDGGF